MRDIAKALGVSVKTVNNVESGRTAVRTSARGRWEEVLGWPPGSLEAAYRRGEIPEGVTGSKTAGAGGGTVSPHDQVPDWEQLNNVDGALALIRDLDGRRAVLASELEAFARARDHAAARTEEIRTSLIGIEVRLGVAVAMLEILQTRSDADIDEARLEAHRIAGERFEASGWQLAADRQDEEPEGLRLRREQDEAAERAGR